MAAPGRLGRFHARGAAMVRLLKLIGLAVLYGVSGERELLRVMWELEG